MIFYRILHLINTFISNQLTPYVWSGVTFLAGVACTGIVDSYLRRRDDLSKFLLDKRVKFLEDQLSLFYWPFIYILRKII